MANLGQVLTAMVTPFDQNLNIDYDQAASLAAWLSDHGSNGIVVAGTTGESPTLSKNEKLELFQQVKSSVGNHTKIIAGTGSNSTEDSIELSQEAVRRGVDGIMLVVPYYNKPSQEGLYQHFKTIVSAVDIPVILYNVPSRTCSNLMPDTVARLAEIDNIVAIKEASGNLEQIARIRNLTPPDFYIYSGDDSLTLPILSLGGCGVISVASHLVGEELQAMINYFLDGKLEEAQQINNRLFPLFKALFITSNPVPVKEALNNTGFQVGGVRLPLVNASLDEKKVIVDTLKKLDLIK